MPGPHGETSGVSARLRGGRSLGPRRGEVPRYYFDTLDGDRFIPDETGVDLPSIEVARAQAARLLGPK